MVASISQDAAARETSGTYTADAQVEDDVLFGRRMVDVERPVVHAERIILGSSSMEFVVGGDEAAAIEEMDLDMSLALREGFRAFGSHHRRWCSIEREDNGLGTSRSDNIRDRVSSCRPSHPDAAARDRHVGPAIEVVVRYRTPLPQ